MVNSIKGCSKIQKGEKAEMSGVRRKENVIGDFEKGSSVQ